MTLQFISPNKETCSKCGNITSLHKRKISEDSIIIIYEVSCKVCKRKYLISQMKL